MDIKYLPIPNDHNKVLKCTKYYIPKPSKISYQNLEFGMPIYHLATQIETVKNNSMYREVCSLILCCILRWQAIPVFRKSQSYSRSLFQPTRNSKQTFISPWGQFLNSVSILLDEFALANMTETKMCVIKKVVPCSKSLNFWKLGPGANPTIASYNASVVNFYNATGSLAHFVNKNIIFYF
jgi:hypothetical protein